MRLLISLAALLATSSTLVPAADACGFVPQPTVFRMSSHLVPGGATRSFVVLRATPNVDHAAWQQLSPLSYDSTKIAELPALEIPSEITLVGPSGTRVVETRHEVALSGGWEFRDTARAALEVPVAEHDSFVLALPGRVDHVAWHDIAWTYRSMPSITGTDLSVSLVKDGVTIRRAGNDLATLTGEVRGALDLGGRRYIVVERAGAMTTVDVGAASRATS